MKNILYEAHYTLNPSIIIAIFIFIFLLLYPKLYFKGFEFNEKQITKHSVYIVKFIQTSAIIFTIFIIALIINADIDIYNKTVKAYKHGDYSIVEGYVENFLPMPKQGHSYEYFEINGVGFSYSDNLISSGYCTTMTNGGIIQKNGQYLKIGYIFHPNYGNIIVYIESTTSNGTEGTVLSVP